MQAETIMHAPRSNLSFAPAAIDKIDLEDGGFILRSPQELTLVETSLSDYLTRWVREAPDRPFLMERGPDGVWQGATFAQTWHAVQSLGQALLHLGLGPSKPLIILSANSVAQGLLTLAAQHIGVPVVPVSVAYSTMATSFEKIDHIFAKVEPGLIFVEECAPFDRVLDHLASLELPVMAVRDDDRADILSYEVALATKDSKDVEDAHSQVGLDSIAKILFTSGSTGMPKGVINTQCMMLSNQQALAQCWPFLEEKPPVIVDWLPWNHTFGSNYNFNMMLRNGGTLYIDAGKPVPGGIDESLRNLKEIAPTMYFNVPRGFDILLPYLEQDEDLRRSFFSQLDLIFYSGAALPDHLWQKLEHLSMSEKGFVVPFVSAWGATETAPMITVVHFPIPSAGVIGLPSPGYSLKFVPNGSKLEMRVKGPCVTPGYWRDEQKTIESFDEEGYYLIGDAGRLEDETAPEKGILFDGRTSENFKLTTGTWVSVGPLRINAIEAMQPLVSDAVVTGHNRDEIGLLVFANLAGCQDVAGDPDLTLVQAAAHSLIQEKLKQKLAVYNAAQKGSSTRIKRVIMLDDSPSVDANEITDKGYINQRVALELRADDVLRLHEDETGRFEVKR